VLCLCGIPDAAADTGSRALEIKPQKTAQLKNGALGLVRGSVDAAGQRFVLRNLTMTKPVAVLLLPADPGQELRISFAKATLETPDLEGSTAPQGHYLARFRTAQDVTLQLRAAKPGAARFLLIVWVGDDLKAQLPTQVLSPEAYRARAGGVGEAPSWSTIGIGVGLLLLLAAAVFWFLRRRRRTP
jgi:LPXTG-motif cell wall-anchored protein